MEKVNAGTIARTICLVISLINLICSSCGVTPIDVQESDVYQAVTDIAVIITAAAAWWKNNSFSQAAIKADKLMEQLKADLKGGK